MDLLSFAQSRLILLSQAWNVHANRYEGLQLRCARFCLQPEGQVHAQNLRNSLFALDSIQDTSKLVARSPKCPANVRKQVLGCPAHSHLTFGPNGHSSKQSYSPTCSQDLHGFSDAPDAHVGKAELLQCQSRLQACRKQLSALRRHPCLPEPGLEGIAGHQNHACCMGISRSSAVKLRLQSLCMQISTFVIWDLRNRLATNTPAYSNTQLNRCAVATFEHIVPQCPTSCLDSNSLKTKT